MPSEVSLCNWALSRLGDEASVISIAPPDGSPQATHCARFYPLARDSILQSHAWGFATQRDVLAAVDVPAAAQTMWDYAYALPNECLQPLAVLDEFAGDDVLDGMGGAQPTPYVVEQDDDGTPIVLTNQPDAVLRYVRRVTDPTLFSPLFCECLTWKLAAAVAGPLLKGDSGMKMTARCEEAAAALLAKAASMDANAQRSNAANMPPAACWTAAR